jgi:hypothetical protein
MLIMRANAGAWPAVRTASLKSAKPGRSGSVTGPAKFAAGNHQNHTGVNNLPLFLFIHKTQKL